MKISTTKDKRELLYTLLSTIGLILIWKGLSFLVDREIIIPSPENTLINLIQIVTGENFWETILNTSVRVMVGFGISVIGAVFLGVMSGLSKTVYYILKPLITLFRTIPTMAVILLAIIWLSSDNAPLLTGFLVVFPILYESTLHGISSIDKKLIEMGQLFNLGWIKMIKDIYMPSIRSNLLAGITATMGLNIKVIIAAEVLSQPSRSVGTSLYVERASLNTSGVFAWSIIAILMATIFEGSVLLLKKKYK